MATVPSLSSPRVSLKPLPAPGIAVGNLQGTFGENNARATAQVAQQLHQAAGAASAASRQLNAAQQRIQTREEALRRTQAIAVAEDSARTLYIDAQRKGLENPDNVTGLKNGLNDLFSQTENDYKGLPGERPIFLENMQKLRSQWSGVIVENAIKAENAAMDSRTATEINKLSTLVGSNPQALEDAQTEYNNWIAQNYEPHASPDQTAAKVAAGQETLATAAVDYLISHQQFDVAMERMSDPNIGPFLSPARQRELRSKIFYGQGAQQKVIAEGTARLNLLRQFGIADNLTAAQQATVLTGVNLPVSSKSDTATKLSELTQLMRVVTNDPNWSPSPTIIQKAYSVYTAPEAGNFGNSLQGRAMAAATELAPTIEAGNFTEDQLNTFLNNVSAASAVNPQTGVATPLSLPVRSALEAQGINPQWVSTPDGVSQYRKVRDQLRAQHEASLPPQTALSQKDMADAMQPVDQGINALSQAANSVPQGPDGSVDRRAQLHALADTGHTFYDMADKLTGIVSTLKDKLPSIDPLGIVLSSPQVRQARSLYPILEEPVIFAVREGSRETEGVSQRIKDSMRAFKTGLWKDPQALRSDMIALGANLQNLEKRLIKAIETEGDVSGERGRDMRDRLDAVQYARKLLGAPAIIASEQEYRDMIQSGELTPGSKYVDPTGEVRVYGGAQPNTGGQ